MTLRTTSSSGGISQQHRSSLASLTTKELRKSVKNNSMVSVVTPQAIPTLRTGSSTQQPRTWISSSTTLTKRSSSLRATSGQEEDGPTVAMPMKKPLQSLSNSQKDTLLLARSTSSSALSSREPTQPATEHRRRPQSQRDTMTSVIMSTPTISIWCWMKALSKQRSAISGSTSISKKLQNTRRTTMMTTMMLPSFSAFSSLL